jgi:pimeloyl-ACP methyl ester carboxylesterase
MTETGRPAEREDFMATYVLVHGAFHGSWCWSRLIPFLEAAGHVAYGPSLTGLGDKAALLSPEVGLSTHVADITGLIREQDLRDVILLGHSYGAMVSTGVVDQVPDRVRHLVYLDSFVPRTGESMVDVGALVVAQFRREARRHGDGWRVDPPTQRPFGIGGLFGVTTEPDLSWVRSMLTPQSLKTFEEPLRLADPGIVARFPRTHIWCTGGGPLVLLLRRLVGPRALPPKEPGWRLRRLSSGHDAMIIQPRALAELLLEIA